MGFGGAKEVRDALKSSFGVVMEAAREGQFNGEGVGGGGSHYAVLLY